MATNRHPQGGNAPLWRLYSWNVNGLRSCATRGFHDWLQRCDGTVVGIQELRAQAAQLPDDLQHPDGWHAHFSPAERAGYSGVALYSRQPPDQVVTTLGDAEFDREGRLQIARFGRLVVVNSYFPNGKGKERDNSRVPYKLRYYAALFEHLETLRRDGNRVVVLGDFNTAHQEIDLARPRENRKISGFLEEERAELSRWLTHGWVDIYRQRDPNPGRYTWWSQRAGARARNVGWRIDYVIVADEVLPFVRGAAIHAEVGGSDHCPVSVDLDSSIVTDGQPQVAKK